MKDPHFVIKNDGHIKTGGVVTGAGGCSKFSSVIFVCLTPFSEL